MSFKQQLFSALLGVVSLFIPAVVINTMTLGIDPVVVFTGVLFAALVGFLFGVHSSQEDDSEEGTPEEPHQEKEPEPTACGTCGFPSEPEHAGWHAMNCSGSGSNANYEEGWQQP